MSKLQMDPNQEVPGSRVPRQRRARQFARSLLRNKGATFAAFLLATFVVVAILAPVIAPHDPLKQNLRRTLVAPSSEPSVDRQGNAQPPNYLGTDKVGRDLLSRIIHGARVSLLVSVASIVFSAAIGTVLALLAGFYRGIIDTIIMTVADIQLSFPTILLAISIVAGLGPGLLNTVIVLTITEWVWYARIIRAQVLSVREQTFVLAAHSVGCSSRRIAFRHVLPQVLPMLLVLASLQVGRVIILEAALSFLGLGVQPPQPSWGNLLADGRELLWTAWWMAVFPGVALSLVVWSSNIFGDWLRDALDPRLRKR